MIALSFDTEEFDVPKEQGGDYDHIRQGMESGVSDTGS